MGNWIAGIVLIGVLLIAVVYIVHSKRSGQPCIGCPYAKHCSKNAVQSGVLSCTECREGRADSEE